MKMIVATTVIIACLLSPTVVHAQTDPVSTLGSGIAKIVAKALFGKALGAVFGSGGLTKTDLNNALAAHFKAHELAVLQSRVNSLKDATRNFNYNPKAELTLVGGDLDNIFLIIHQIVGDIETHISADNFRTLLPNYVFVTNVRLAFQGHK